MNSANKVTHNPPTEKELKTGVELLFSNAKKLAKTMVTGCLYPNDKLFEQGLPAGEKQLTLVPFWEIDELNFFVQMQIEQFNSVVSDIAKARISLILYCHIMEADFPMAVIYNLLRILGNDKPSWVFLGLDKNQKEIICEHPSGKIREIARRSSNLNLPIGELLKRMWKDAIRNSFMHSNYALLADRFIPCKGLSPISRKSNTSFQENSMNPTPTLKDIIAYGLSAVDFLSSFNHEYKIMRELYNINYTRK